MIQHILFRCDICKEETTIKLEDLTQMPVCPTDQCVMTPVGNTDEVQDAVNEVMNGLSRLAAVALRNTDTGPLGKKNPSSTGFCGSGLF